MGAAYFQDRFVKTIFEPSLIKQPLIHNAYFYNATQFWTCNTNGNRVRHLHHDLERPLHTIQLNHYRAHSFEEFMILDQRNRAGVPKSKENVRSLEESRSRFEAYDNNTLTDIDAYLVWKANVEGKDFSKYRLIA